MSQAAGPERERRGEPRRPAAFAFWFEPVPAHERTSGWMTDVAASGASFLTSAEHVPAVGQRLALAEMFSQDRLVREGNPALPQFARVVRVDTAPGPTRRIAVRFEADAAVPVPRPWIGRSVAACPNHPEHAPVPPPIIPRDGGFGVLIAVAPQS